MAESGRVHANGLRCRIKAPVAEKRLGGGVLGSKPNQLMPQASEMVGRSSSAIALFLLMPPEQII